MSDFDANAERIVAFQKHVPFSKELGLTVEELAPSRVRMRLPWADDLVGNPETGVLHGGCITTLLDSACGGAVFLASDASTWFATLDLRIDYLKPATPGRDVVADAHCFKMTRTVAFVRATAFHDDPDDPIAAAVGTFMRHTLVPVEGR